MNLSRSNVEESEKIICEYLCSPTHFSAIRRSSLREGLIADKIKSKISGNILDAVHIGNSYDSIGDIKLKLEDGGLRFCELKMSESTGRGTAFNITVKTFTETGVFETEVLSWKEYMNQHDHTETVTELLESYEYYPESIHDEYNTAYQKRKTLGRYIRDYVDDNAESVESALECSDQSIQQAAQIKTDIKSFDRSMKKSFLKYLDSQSINSERLKAIALVLAGGYHKKKQVVEFVDVVEEVSDMVGGINHVFDDYRVFYAHNVEEGKEGLTVKSGNQETAIDVLSDKSEWKFSFTDEDETVKTTSFSIGFVENDLFTPVYRISLNWKNVFQGIASPSVNGFKADFFKRL